jgi:SpoVK/Ycf46/Vps4 family AAA+-type ATPase
MENLNEDALKKYFETPGVNLFENNNFEGASQVFYTGMVAAKSSNNPQMEKRFSDGLQMAQEKLKSNPPSEIENKNKDDDAVRVIDPVDPTTLIRTFDKLGGLEREKQEIRQRFIYPYMFPNMLTAGTGLLLYGPPGTGKTLLAEAIVNEFKNVLTSAGRNDSTIVNFFVGTGAEIKGKYVGGTEKNLKSYFKSANDLAASQIQGDVTNAVSIIFMDEIDAIAGNRSSGDQNMNASVNSLLQLTQGAVKYDHVIFMAATNLPWSLDPAVLRRFTVKLFVDLPSNIGRKKIILEKMKKLKAPKDDEKLLQDVSTLVRKLVIATGFTNEGTNRLNELVMVDQQKLLDFIGESHYPDPTAKHPLGVSASDLSEIMDTGLTNIGIQKLRETQQKVTGDGMCAPLPGPKPKCEGDDGGCTPCELTQEEKSKLRLTMYDMLKYQNHMMEAVESFGTTVQFSDYVDFMNYQLGHKTPEEVSKDKLTNAPHKATVSQAKPVYYSPLSASAAKYKK